MIAHAMADMTNTICGHDRDVLILALSWARDVWANDDTSLRELATMPWRAKNPARYAVIAAIIDPAKLAEMLAARGRELDVERWEFAEWAGKVLCCFRRKLGAKVQESDTRELDPVQARAILLQWLQLPDGAREEAEKALRGET